MMTPDQLVNELERRLDGPHSDEQTTAAAWLTAEAVRYLNYATGSHAAAGVTVPSTVCTVLGQLAEAAYRHPQLCRQLADWLEAQTAAAALGDDNGGPVAVRIDRARRHLDMAAVRARQLADALDAAQQATSSIHATGGETR